MSLSRIERETIILFNEEEKQASVYTYNGKLQRKLKELSGKYPKQIFQTDMDGSGSVTYSIPKNLISIRQPVSEEARENARKRMLQSNFRSKP